MQCSKCPREAIVFQPYSGLHLCGQHLIADIEAKAKKMIRAQGWLNHGDHIAVLLSGDQKSSALLSFLKHLTAQRRDIWITAITLTKGTGTHSTTLLAKRIAERLETEIIEVSLPEEPGNRADTGKGKNPDVSSPSVSPIAHSILIDEIAQLPGITGIALGLCLDDAAGFVLESIIRGDAERLVRSSPGHDEPRRICPFIAISAEEISLYAALCGFDDEQRPGLERGDRLHKDTIRMLDRYTNNHPATRYALLNLGKALAGSS
ncbi:MAG: tRNA(Ile)-lysidine synthase, partial [Methanoregula sp.]|nr:tRNA(Ile)-lysidine synthase [Methanoregula sp.]